MIVSILAYAGLNIITRDVTFIRETLAGDFFRKKKVDPEYKLIEEQERELKKQEKEKRQLITDTLDDMQQMDQPVIKKGESVGNQVRLLKEKKEENREFIRNIKDEIAEIKREKRDLIEDKRELFISERDDRKIDYSSEKRTTKVGIIGIPIFTLGQIVYREIKYWRLIPGFLDKYAHYLFSLTFQGFFNAILTDNWKIIIFDSFLVSASIYIGKVSRDLENRKI